MLDFILNIDPLYIVSGVIVGTLVGFTGVGGGSLMTPLLILFFGIAPHNAVGTDLLYAAATKTAGTAVHGFNKTIDWTVVGRLALGSIPATAVTIYALSQIGVDSKAAKVLITQVLSFALLITAASLFARPYLQRLYQRRFGELSMAVVIPATIVTGVILGVLVTISSVGAGAIGVTALVFLYPHMPAPRIVGSDIAHAVPLTLLAGMGHWWLGTIDWGLLISLLLGSVPAIIVASYFAVRVPERAIRYALGTVLVLVCARFWLVA